MKLDFIHTVFLTPTRFFEPYLSYGFSAKSRLVLALLVLFTVLWATLIFSLSCCSFGATNDDVETR